MSKHPWTIGEQTLVIQQPRPPDLPEDREWPSLQLVFSHDPTDTSTKRLRIVPPNLDAPAAEVTLTGNGTIQDIIFQPRHRRPWDRSLPAVVMVDGSWCHAGPVGKDEAPKPLTEEETAEYDALAAVYRQPLLGPGPNVPEAPAQEGSEEQQPTDPNNPAPRPQGAQRADRARVR